MTPTALVVGAGDNLGSAIARRFAREGMHVVASRRRGDLSALTAAITAAGGQATAIHSDARDEAAVRELVEATERIGPMAACIFNVGGNVRFPIAETTTRVYRKVWEMCALAGFLVGREAAAPMRGRGAGTILFTGASASVKGYPQSATFAMGKFALRGLAQSIARELHPKGIHVAHFVIDGAIRNPGRTEPADAPDSMLDPDAIARSYLQVLRQDRSAWTHEVELRPWVEKF